MSGLFAWFGGRSLREQRLLLVMVALLGVTLLWHGIVRPVGDALVDARARHAAAVIRLGRTQAAADAIRDIQRHRSPPLTGSLADAVRARAADAGFALTSLTPDGPDGVRIGIQSARPAALLPWLARLEAAGVLVDAASFTDNRDRTVGVALTLRARGA